MTRTGMNVGGFAGRWMNGEMEKGTGGWANGLMEQIFVVIQTMCDNRDRRKTGVAVFFYSRIILF